MNLEDALRAAIREVLIDALEETVPAALAEALESVQPQHDRLLNRQELAQRLGVSERTVDTLRHSGLPTVWVLESPRFEFGVVVEWLKKRREKHG